MGNHHPRRGFMSFALFLGHIAILFLLPFSCSVQAPHPHPTPAAAPISGQEMLNFALSAQSRSSPFTHIFQASRLLYGSWARAENSSRKAAGIFPCPSGRGDRKGTDPSSMTPGPHWLHCLYLWQCTVVQGSHIPEVRLLCLAASLVIVFWRLSCWHTLISFRFNFCIVKLIIHFVFVVLETKPRTS